MISRGKFLIRLAIVLIAIAGFFGALAKALYPAYTYPNSRLWSSSLGYPNLLRHMNKPIPVDVTQVTERDLERVISADGRVVYLNEVPVNVEVLGLVTKLSAEPGDRVHIGQTLLSLDTGGYSSRIAGLDVELKRNKYEETLKDYNRERDAFSKGLISETSFEQFRRGMEAAQIDYQRAKESYENAVRSRSVSVIGSNSDNKTKTNTKNEVEIVSPIDGTIVNQQIVVGENLVRPKENVMTIGDRLIFKASFDQRYLSWIEASQEVTIYLSAFPGKPFKGEVQRVNNRVQTDASITSSDAARMSFLAWIRSDAIEQQAAYGMNGYCTIRYPFKSLAIPENALMRYSGREGMVMVVNSNHRIELRAVTYSLSLDGWVAIDSGLEPNQLVVTSGQLGLDEGDLVKIQ